MRKITLQILVVLFFSFRVFAQNETRMPILFDRFGDLPLGHLLSRLDALGWELHQNKDFAAFIKISGGRNARSDFIFPYTRGAIMKAYLVGSRKFAAERIRFQNCDLEKDDVIVELFIVPQNYDIPKCNDAVFVPDNTVLLTTRHFENPYIVYDYPYEIIGGEEATSKIFHNTLLKMLAKSPESKVYLIVHLGTNPHHQAKKKRGGWEEKEIRKLDKPALTKKMLHEAQQELVRNGVDVSRIVKIEGGYQDSTRNIEFWFVPKDGEIPKPKPDYFLKRKDKK
jgi:hypothetical protein